MGDNFIIRLKILGLNPILNKFDSYHQSIKFILEVKVTVEFRFLVILWKRSNSFLQGFICKKADME